MALGDYWGRNAKSKLECRDQASLLRVTPQASQRKWCFQPVMSVATQLRYRGSRDKHRKENGVFDQ
ncbi:hypothetical protein ACOSQ4_027084 [Xanthoceras sorbifolium]